MLDFDRFSGMALGGRPNLHLNVGDEVEVYQHSDPEWWEVGCSCSLGRRLWFTERKSSIDVFEPMEPISLSVFRPECNFNCVLPDNAT